MPGPSIVVRVLGDLSGLSKSVQAAGKAGSQAAAGMHDAFRGVLSTLNTTGVLGPFGEALAGIDEAIGRVAEHGKQIGPGLMAAGGALAGIGVGLAAVGSKDQAAHAQLQQAIEATGRSYDDYEKQVEGAVKQQEKFGHTANQTQDALRILTQATGDPAKALQYLGTASDLAAAKHEGLAEAATSLGKVYNGNTRLLKEFGIQATKAGAAQNELKAATAQATAADSNLAHAKRTLADIELVDAGRKHLTVGQAIQLRNAQEAVTTASAKAVQAHQRLSSAQTGAANSAKAQGQVMGDLSAKLHGQASAAADTFTGHLNAIKAKVEDAAASFGQKYGPAITAAGAGTTLLGGAITAGTKGFTALSEAMKGASTATEAMSAAEDTAAVSEGLALAPILLIIGALAVLGVAAYVIYRNWTTIWGAIKTAAKAVWDWIKTYWPLLVGILLGPIGIVAVLIARHWKAIWDGIKAVYNWIVKNWPLLLAILTGPIGLAIRWIVQNWSGIVGFFKRVISDITGVFSLVFHSIVDPINSAFTWLGRQINSVVGWFADLPRRIGSVIGGIVDVLAAPFKFVFNGIAWLWNHTVGELSFRVPSWIPGIGGKGFDMPKIPSLAQGGLITSTGLVFAHAGEVISPAPAGSSGPAVVVQHASFSSELDIEAFMRKAAWYVQTARI
jgi:hypothetical protein